MTPPIQEWRENLPYGEGGLGLPDGEAWSAGWGGTVCPMGKHDLPEGPWSARRGSMVCRMGKHGLPDGEACIARIHHKIIETCKLSYKTKKQKINKPPNWWTPELEIMKKRVSAFRRRAQRATEQKEDGRKKASQIYARERALYRRKLVKSRRRAWRKFCTEASNPYGPQYKAIFRKGKPPSDLFQQTSMQGTELEIATSILQTIYPETETGMVTATNRNTSNDRPFTLSELKHIIHKLNKSKAPGYDGIDNIILLQLLKAVPDLLLLLMNRCSELGLFPSCLKIGVVLLFYKEGKDQEDPKSYRPITLLPSLGKLLEKLTTQRLNYHLKVTDQQNPRQYGFKEGKSIDNALDSLLQNIDQHKKQKHHIAIVSIDIKGAFDSLKYPSIIEKIRKSSCPSNIQQILESLLENRTIVIPTNEGLAQQRQTRGCPQGSCSGPALWNLVADEVLGATFPENTTIQAFADDFLIVAAAESERKLGKAASDALKVFKAWSDKHDLQISVEKTKFLQISKLKRGPSVFWGDRRVKRTSVLKYLGVHIDKQLNWAHHLVQQGAKALQQQRSLIKIAGCTWGISAKFRAQLYRTVTERTLAHGVSAWGRYMSYKIKTKLDQIQRPFLLNITGAYRTSPTLALQVITGIQPLPIRLEMEANYIKLTRLRQDLTLEDNIYRAEDYEEKATGWSQHPATFLAEDQVSAEEEVILARSLNIFTDGSKMEHGVGAAFCAQDEQGHPLQTWQGKLRGNNSIFQAELAGIREAITYAERAHVETKIWSDSQSSLKAIANIKTTSPQAREIQDQLLANPQVRLGWIRAHVGHQGNEKADELAKAAITSTMAQEMHIPLPRSSIKRELNRKAMERWQLLWDRGKNGRSTHDVLPKVSNSLHNWPRQVTQFITGHGPFPAYLFRFGKHPDDLCACGQEGTPFHYATACPITESFHLKCPREEHKTAWHKSIVENVSISQKVVKLIDFMALNEHLVKSEHG
ncbi:Putative protein in type-1 retrotransposable element R1DM [Araneus ventricosus]|uniref:Retrovirus-related Pol polyprotein from type-1 retrotransposable element R1 n=1 Tax=Araneus ventricosus TaxID=182803 RepID=A0A4Y2E2G4_ARAVE|nr:Putative protein in type-1 retrotransposable element R1DM [Araneus ventricosus]GBM22085.1 Putative protein in type-1 retrotransposable element R1DM [Araneus ventricosus]